MSLGWRFETRRPGSVPTRTGWIGIRSPGGTRIEQIWGLGRAEFAVAAGTSTAGPVIILWRILKPVAACARSTTRNAPGIERMVWIFGSAHARPVGVHKGRGSGIGASANADS